MGSWLKKLGIAVSFSLLVGCGAASPPLGIPAPVSSLMTLEGPDINSTVAVFGAPGAVLADAVVTGLNVSVASRRMPWEGLLWGIAHAQQGNPTQRSVVSASDGSFRMRIRANPGEVIRIFQTVDGETSPGTDLVVPDPIPGVVFP